MGQSLIYGALNALRKGYNKIVRKQAILTEELKNVNDWDGIS